MENLTYMLNKTIMKSHIHVHHIKCYWKALEKDFLDLTLLCINSSLFSTMSPWRGEIGLISIPLLFKGKQTNSNYLFSIFQYNTHERNVLQFLHFKWNCESCLKMHQDLSIFGPISPQRQYLIYILWNDI